MKTIEFKTDIKRLTFTKYSCVEIELSDMNDIITFILSSDDLKGLKAFLDSVGNTQIKDCPVEIANDIWNAAIEAAAKQAAHCIGVETLLATHVSMEIRKLKK